MKYKRLFILILIYIIPISCFCSSNTYTRTYDKTLTPNDVVVDNSNITDILNTPAVSSKEKIYDFADLLTEKEEEELFDSITEFINYSEIDVAIVTTKDLKGFNISDYAYNFYDYNDFKNDGVVFVVYVGESEPSIYMGNSGASDGVVFSVYTDVRIQQTLKYVYQDIKIGNYNKGITNYIKIIKGFFNIDRNGNYRIGENGQIIKSLPWFDMIILSLSLTFIIVMVLVLKLRKNKVLYKDNLDYFIDNDSIMIKTEKDEFVDSSLVKEK